VRRLRPLPGAEKAHEAADAIGAALLLPEFGPDELRLSDWQDWREVHGREALASRVFDAVREAPRGGWQDRVGSSTRECAR
jgi:phage/plasmid primase-like uncharacterized protein